MTKRERMEIYFFRYPNYLEMAQRWECSESEQDIAGRMKCSLSCVQNARKELVKLLEVEPGCWDNICNDLLKLGLIEPCTRIKYSHKPEPGTILIQKIEELQGREEEKKIKKKDREWKKKLKGKKRR
jgi:hypothetical protein